MRRIFLALLVLCAPAIQAQLPPQQTPPWHTIGARELINVVKGDTLLPEFSFLPADTSLRLIGSRLVVRSDNAMPSIFLRIYKVSRNPDGTVKSKVMLSADTVSAKVGLACLPPYIYTRFGECAGDTTRPAPLIVDTTRAPSPTPASAPAVTARSASTPLGLFSAPVESESQRRGRKTFNQLLNADPKLRALYKEHPEIAPRHLDQPVGVDNQVNPVNVGIPPRHAPSVERVIPTPIPIRKKSPPTRG